MNCYNTMMRNPDIASAFVGFAENRRLLTNHTIKCEITTVIEPHGEEHGARRARHRGCPPGGRGEKGRVSPKGDSHV